MFSRLAHNFVKHGYFPTDEATLAGIFSLLNVPATQSGIEPTFRVLDPCCGEGSALAELKANLQAKGAKVTAYGIEKDAERATQAKQWLDVAVCSDAFDMRVGSGAFDLLFLNPPYGNVVADAGQTGNSKERRFEEQFCSTYFHTLRAGGVLVLIVPFYILGGNIDTLIAEQFDAVQVFEAPEKQFKQCVVVGVKKRASEIQKFSTKELLYSFKRAEVKPVLTEALNAKTYELRAGKDQKEFPFVKFTIDEAQLMDEVARLHGASLWPQFEARFNTNSRVASRPLCEPGNWHIALMLAAGHLQGIVRSADGQILLVRGNTYKTRTKEETQVEKSNGEYTTVVTFTDKFNPVIKGINLTVGSPRYGELLSIQ